MKPFISFLAITTMALFSAMEMTAQCVPDTANCKDTGLPGEICPQTLPPVVVNEPYDEAITFIPPAQFVYQGTPIDIAFIIVDSVTNLPPGIDYFPNADTFYADTAYCVQIVGTPTEAGDYHLGIYVTPFIEYFNTIIQGEQIANDTSVVLTVHGSSGIDPNQAYEFYTLPSAPNPFSDYTRLGFYTPFDDRIHLEVYNILGELVYDETMGSSPGTHYFEFNGNELLPGTYFYRIANSSRLYTGKFIKSR